VSSDLENVVTGDAAGHRFTDNFIRLLGMHALTQNFAAGVIGVSSATMSSWMNGKSSPSLSKAIAIAEVFGITTDRLIGAEFADLVEHELASRERYEKVEERLRRSRSSLKSL
jgi:transcriptional regulator with XRE-family HTH domain